MYFIMTNNSNVATLVLKSYKLVGTSDMVARKNIMTFRNINLQVLMGQMYNDYNKFKLIIRWISADGTSVAMNWGTSCTYLTVGGLQFLNNTYDVSSKSNTSTVNIAPILFSFSANTPTQIHYTADTGVIFAKPVNTVDLALTFVAVNVDAPINDTTGFTTVYPNVVISFDIVGVESSRIEK